MKTLICITSVLLMFACSEKVRSDKEQREIDKLADQSDSAKAEMKMLDSLIEAHEMEGIE